MISVRPFFFSNHRPSSPPYQALSPPTDYQTATPSSPNVSPPLSPITTTRISPSKLLLTPKSSPPSLTSSPPAPTQPSKHSPPLTISLDPVKLIFSTPRTSPYALFYSLEDLPPRATNRPPTSSLIRINRTLSKSTPTSFGHGASSPTISITSSTSRAQQPPFLCLPMKYFTNIANTPKSLSIIFVMK
uniref:Uncharacterized protein n=1 Tax=Tanacetum cinerariifolium TaxID=118510 RepID=A0A699JH57_TANCI|nr:hypothetical protein [Tanacetum cinerariifolium]